jgi:DHA2 family multidrug resistance protein
MVAMPIVGILMGKVDFRKVTATGFIVVAISLWQFGAINLEISMWNIIMPNVLMGMGLSMIFVPLSAVSMGTLPREEIGNASGIFNLMRNIGGSVGISVVTTLLVRRAQVHQSNLVSHLAPGDPSFQGSARELGHAFRHFFNPYDATARAGGTLYNELIRQSTLMAFIDNFRLLAAVIMLCVGAVLLFKKVKVHGPISAE